MRSIKRHNGCAEPYGPFNPVEDGFAEKRDELAQMTDC